MHTLLTVGNLKALFRSRWKQHISMPLKNQYGDDDNRDVQTGCI